MALVVYDRVLQTGTANTTVSFSLSGTVTGYQSFAVVGDGNTTYYSATDGTNWETGLGTYASSGTVLTRTTVLQSSNSGSAVTFSGTVTVWIDYTASKSIYKDTNGNITANSFTPGWAATATAAGTTNLTVASTYYQRFTGTSAQTVLLPSATTVALGQGFIIDNDSTGNITLQDNASGALGSIVSGMAVFIFCESNSTQAGSWSGYMFVPGSGPLGQVTWGTSGLSAGGGSITNATWAGSVISSTYLPTVTLGSTAVTLGTTVATFAGMTLNSPTFVTPVLGTPSSGTLSSCSGYNSNSLSGVTLASTVITSSLTSVGSLGNTQIASLGVGTAASGTSGEIRATNNVTAYYSDDRMKINLGNIPNALDKLKTLNGFYYEANELAQSMGYEVKKEVGVSAQQVQAIMPEVVAPAPIDDRYLTVRYERLVPLLIEAIKELESQVAELKAK